MNKLTIDRNKWCRGGKLGESALLNDRGAMCCLGFLCLAAGFEKRDIEGVGEPDCLDNQIVAERKDDNNLLFGAMIMECESDCAGPYFAGRDWVPDAIRINDNTDMSDAEREEELSALFKDEAGIELEFIDGEAIEQS